MKPGHALTGIALLLALGCSPPKRPNIVVVVVDTLRSDHLSHAGYPLPTAAGLDDLSSKATFFPNAHAPAPWTRPSVASLLTGLFPTHHGVTGGTRLSDDVETLAEVLAAHGWTTAAFSFNHNVARETGMAQGFERFDDFLGETRDYPDISVMVRRVGFWLDSQPAEPFFLYLHPMNPHGPYNVPNEHRADLLGRWPRVGFHYYGGVMTGILRRRELDLRRRVGRSILTSLVEQYDTAVRYTGDQLGSFFADLDHRDLFDDALVIVTSDHGEELFDHGGFSHGFSLHEEVLRVPLYVKRPGQKRGETRLDSVSLLDIFPTVLDLVGIPHGDVDGRSARIILEGGEMPPRPRAHHVSILGRCVGRAYVDGRYKLIELDSNYEGRRDETLLFDLVSDPGERENLALEEPDLVASMKRGLDLYMSNAAEGAFTPVPIEHESEQLRALGYLE